MSECTCMGYVVPGGRICGGCAADLRSEVARLTARVAEVEGERDRWKSVVGVNDPDECAKGHKWTGMGWCPVCCKAQDARVAELEPVERAARSLMERQDFWRNAGTLPGEYDNLVDALAGKETP